MKNYLLVVLFIVGIKQTFSQDSKCCQDSNNISIISNCFEFISKPLEEFIYAIDDSLNGYTYFHNDSRHYLDAISLEFNSFKVYVYFDSLTVVEEYNRERNWDFNKVKKEKIREINLFYQDKYYVFTSDSTFNNFINYRITNFKKATLNSLMDSINTSFKDLHFLYNKRDKLKGVALKYNQNAWVVIYFDPMSLKENGELRLRRKSHNWDIKKINKEVICDIWLSPIPPTLLEAHKFKVNKYCAGR